MSKIKKAPSWAIRKVAYALVALVVGVLGAFGIASEVQADQWTQNLDALIPWVLGIIAPAVAASKTHAGSDSTATDADAEAAMIAGTATTVQDQVEIAVHDALARIPGADQTAQAVLAAIRAEEKGEHDPTSTTAPATQTVAPGDDADYVYGR